ncbi:MAG: hypothetical protein ACRD1Y_14570 [Terriglobales bacterium]
MSIELYKTGFIKEKVADEAWVATATLQREKPEAEDFSVREIWDRAQKLGFKRVGVFQHIQQHDVANRKPNPGRYRMLVETRRGRRRLYREGDPYDPRREGAKIAPSSSDLAAAWQDLLPWYADWSRQKRPLSDPLLELWGSGRELWRGEDPDAYVERVRQGWEESPAGPK